MSDVPGWLSLLLQPQIIWAPVVIVWAVVCCIEKLQKQALRTKNA